MTKSPKDKSDVPEHIAGIYESLAQAFEVLKKLSSAQTLKYGYFQECCEDRRDFYQNCPYYEGLEDLIAPLKKVERFVKTRQAQIETQSAQITSGAFVVSTSAAVSDIVALPVHSLAPTPVKPPKVPPWWNEDTMDQHARLFDRHRAGLGNLLRGAWESYYGATHESSRNALTNMRELFDQFFDVMSPDRELRNSKFFKRKKHPNENSIHRPERLKYAVNKIKDKTIAEYLGSQIKPILKTYKKLNILHKRGHIDRDFVRDAVIATAMYLFQWLKAIEGD